MKIKINVLNDKCRPKKTTKQQWIDLYSAKSFVIDKKVKNETYNNDDVFCFGKIPLGVTMKIPKGYEIVINTKDSTYQKFKLLIPSGNIYYHDKEDNKNIEQNEKIIENDSYEWHIPFICLTNKKITINEGDKIAQFKIQLSQKATILQKIKWVFTNKINFISQKR